MLAALQPLNAQGNVVVAGSFDVGTLNIKTGANFVLNAPSSQFNVGGDPAGANSPWDALASAAATNQKNVTDANIGSVPNGQALLNAAENTTTAASNVIAANNIVISAQTLNINGVLQSGIADYNVTVTAAQESQISAADDARKAFLDGDLENAQSIADKAGLTPDATFRYFQFNSPALQTATDPISGLSYNTQTSTDDNIAIYWDAINQQLVVNAVKVQGGFMNLTGRILSTGQGQINVLDGFGRINIDNQTTHPLVVNQLDTGSGVAGVLQIVDTGNEDANGDPLETVYKRLNGSVQESQFRFLIPGEATFDSAKDVSGTKITVQLSAKLGTSNAPAVQYTVGEQVLYEADGSTPIGGLSDHGIYYIVSVAGNQVQLSATKGGTPIPLTASTSAGAQQTLIPLVLITTTANTRTASYTPESSGYRYFWTTGQDQTSLTETTYATAKWLGSDALAKDPGNVVAGPVVTLATPRPLLEGSYIAASTDMSNFSYTFQQISANSTFDPHTGVSGTTITLANANHKWTVGDELSFSVNGNAAGNVGGLADSSNYFVVFVSPDGTQIRLSATANGTPITLTSASGTLLTDTLTSQPATETEAQWNTSTWYGTTTYYTKVKTFSDQKDINTYSIKADRSIAIDFIGQDNGAVDITSDGDLILAGAIRNTAGTTSLTADGAIEQTTSNSLGGLNIALSAGNGIGDTGALQTNLTDAANGSLSATTTSGDIHIEETSGNLTVGLIKANKATGTVTLAAQGSILAGSANSATSLVQASSISLTATTGSIGALAGGTAASPGAGARPLLFDTGDSSTSTLTAIAKTNISVEETTGDLRVAKIAGMGSIFQGVTTLAQIVNQPAGDVRVVVDSGNLIDADTLQQADPRTQQELETLWNTMTATVSTAQASISNTIAAYEAQQTRNYQTYWQLRNQQPNASAFDPNFTPSISSAQVAAYTTYYTNSVTPAITNVVVNGRVSALSLGAANPFSTGAAVVYRDHGGADIAIQGGGALVDGQTYYVIASDVDADLDGTHIELASTQANALAGTAIVLSADSVVSSTQTVGFDGTALTTYVSTALTTIENDLKTQYDTLNVTYGKLTSSYDPNYAYHANDTSNATQTFDSSAVNTATNVITLPANSFLTGQAVVYHQGSGSVGKLVDGTTYYVISEGANATRIELARSYDDATAPTPVAIDLGSATGSGMMLTPAGASGQAIYQTFSGADVDTVADTVDLPQHVFTTGMAVIFHAVHGSVAGLTDGSTYYVVVDSANTADIQLASSFANATAGTPIAIDLGTAAGSGMYFSEIDVLAQRAAWTDSQLNNPINPNILGPKATNSTQADIKDPAIVGHDVYLSASGAIGSSSPTVTISWPITPTLLQTTPTAALALVTAERSDLQFFTADGTEIDDPENLAPGQVIDHIVITPALDMHVSAAGKLDIVAGQTAFVGSEDAIQLDHATAMGGSTPSATGQLRVEGKAGITDGRAAGDTGVNTQSGDLFLEGGLSGGIGSAGHPIDVLIASGFSLAAARANGDVHINAPQGDLNLQNVFSTSGDAHLSAAGSILDGLSDFSNPGGPLPVVQAVNIDLTSTGGAIGADADHPLAIAPSSGTITATAHASIFIEDVSGSDTMVNRVQSDTGDVTLISLASILDAHPGDLLDDAIGNNIFLTAGDLGSIGAAGGADFKVDTAFSGPGTLTSVSGLNTFVEKLVGDLGLNTITTMAGTAFILAPDGKILNGNTTGGSNILAGKTFLFASEDIGTAANPISAKVGNVQGESTTGDTYLSNTGALTVGGVVAGDDVGFMAGGSLNLSTHSPLIVSEKIQAGDIKLIAMDKAGDNDYLIINSGVTVQSTAGNVLISGGDDVTISAGAIVKAAGKVTIQGDNFVGQGLNADPDPGVGSHIVLAGTITATAVEVDGGDDADSFDIVRIDSPTTIYGGNGDDTFTINPDSTTTNTINAPLTVDGQEGNDGYVVNFFGAGSSLISVHDSGSTHTGDLLTLNGTPNGDQFLLRKNFVGKLLHGANGDGTFQFAERVNYDSTMGGLIVNGLGGNNAFSMDDNSTPTTLNGGSGNDSFQIGQLFGNDRLPPYVATGDEISTIHTTRGYVSVGASYPVTANGGGTLVNGMASSSNDTFIMYHNAAVVALNGGAGDNLFVVQAFALFGSHNPDPNQQQTNVNGGQGASTIEYAINAPVNIKGGAGLNTLVILGTELNDTIAVTSAGISGSGVNVNYTGIQIIEVDTQGGNDSIYIGDVAAGSVVKAFGGPGSDTFYVAQLPGGFTGADPSNLALGDLARIQGSLVLGGALSDVPALNIVTILYPGESDPPTPQNQVQTVQPTDVDTVNIDNSASPRNDSGTLTEDNLTGFGMGGPLTIRGHNYLGGVTFSDVTILNLKLSPNGNTLAVQDLTGSGLTTVHVTVVPGKKPDQSTDKVSVHGTAGNDNLLLDNSAGSISLTGLPYQVLVSGLGLVHDVYTLTTDGGDDTVTLGDSGSIGQRVENLVGTFIVDGGTGSNMLDVTDDTDFTLNPTTLQRASGGITHLQNLQVVNLVGGVSNNSFTILNFPGTTTLRGDGGVDRLYLTMTGGTVITLDTLVLAADVVTNPASGPALLQIDTTLELGSATRGFNIAAGLAAEDMIVTGSLVNGGVVKYGLGTLSFEGSISNLYVGTTTVKDGVLLFGRTNGAFAAQGPVVVGDAVGAADSAILRFMGSNQLPVVAVSTMSDGLLDLNGFKQTVSSLSMTGGDVKTGTGVLTLAGPVNGFASATPATINGILDLGGVDNRLFNIARGPGGDDMVVNALIQDGGLVKSGAGILVFANNNAYQGNTVINGGTLVVTTNGALGTTDKGTSVQTGGTLAFRADNHVNVSYTTAEPLTITGTGTGGTAGAIENIQGTNLFAGPVLLVGSPTANSLADNLTLSGVISGSGSFTKIGPAAISFGGAGANNYTGTTYVNVGTLNLNKSAAGVVAIPAALVVGDGQGALLSAIVHFQGGSNQMAAVPVAINSDGWFDLNGFSQTISTLTMTGGSVTTAADNAPATLGLLTLSGDVTGTADVQDNPALIAGHISLNGIAARKFTVNQRVAEHDDMIVSAIVSNGGVDKEGNGQVVFAGNNDYAGLTLVGAGTLVAVVNNALGTVAGSTTVSGGTLAFRGNVNYTTLETVYLNGPGVTVAGGSGAINSIGGNNTFAGPITLNSPAAIGSSVTGQSLTLTGGLNNGGFLLTLTGLGDLVFKGVISGTGGVTKGRAGFSNIDTGFVYLAGNNGYSGNTLVMSGTVVVQSSTALGTIAGATTVAAGGTLAFPGGITYGPLEALYLNGTGYNGLGALENLGGLNSFSGPIFLQSNSLINSNAAGGKLTLNGVLTNSGVLPTFTGPGDFLVTNTITGTGGLTKLGTGTLTLSGTTSNNYKGVTTVGDGKLFLNKSNGQIAVSGPLVVGDSTGAADSAEARWVGAGNQLGLLPGDSTTLVPITVNQDGLLNLNGFNNSITTLTMQGGDATTGTGTLTANGTIAGLASSRTATIAGNLNVGGAAERFFTIADGTAADDMVVSAIIGNGGLTKLGDGTLVFTSKNTYVGPTVISDGTLVVTADAALGSTAGGTTVQAGGTLAFRGGFTYSTPETVTLYGSGFNNSGAVLNAGGVNTFAGSLVLASAATIKAAAGSTLTFSKSVAALMYKLTVGGPGTVIFAGAFTGSGILDKIDAGTLTMNGSSANSFTGTADIDAGTLNLDKNGVAIQGNLVVGDGSSPAGSAVVHMQATGQLSSSSSLTVRTGGLVDFGGFGQSGSVSLTGGSINSGGATPVALAANVSLTTGASTMSGSYVLSGSSTFTIAQGASLTINGPISGSGGLVLRGGGTLILSGSTANTFSGASSLYQGTLVLAKTAGVAALAGLTNLTIANVPDALAATLQLAASDQIADTTTITVNRNGVFDLHGFNETIASLALNGGQVNAGAGLLTLNGDVTSTSQAASITGNIALGTGAHTFTVNQDGQVTVTGTISGAGSLVKAGPGQLTIANPATYTGTTTVSAGKLTLTANQPASAVLVTGSGSLSISGNIAGLMNVGGKLAIDTTQGALTANGTASFSSSSALSINLSSVSTTALTITGAATLGGTLALTKTAGFNVAVGASFTLLQVQSITGTFAGLNEGATLSFGGMTFKISYAGGKVTLKRTA